MRSIKLKDTFYLGFCLLIILASYIRIYYGIDLTDESFYISLPYRFILGDRPILDEYSMHQFAGTLTYPFYKLFFIINHSTQGIVLFSRQLYFILFSLLGYYIFSILKKILGWQISLLIACVALLDVPFNIMGLSYNTISMLCFALGTFGTFKYQQDQSKSPRALIFSGFCYSLAVYAYPTFIIPVLSSTIILCLFINCRKVVLNLFLGTLPMICIFSWLLYDANFEIKNVLNYVHQNGYTNKGLLQFYELFIEWNHSASYIIYALLLLVFPWKKTNRYKQFQYFNLLALPFILIAVYLFRYISTNNPLAWYQFIINFTLLALIYLPFIKNKTYYKSLFYLIWMPSLIAGFITSMTSANGFVNFTIGLFPGFIISIATIYLAFNNIGANIKLNHSKVGSEILSMIPNVMLISCLIVLLIYKFSFVYREPSFFNLNNRIEFGPYKNLYTSQSNQKFILTANYDMKELINTYHAKNILVFPSFSGLYLFTNLKPLTNSVWIVANVNNFLTLDYFNHIAKSPEIVFVFKSYLKQQKDVLLNYLNEKKYIEIKDRGMYTIYISHNFLD